MLHIESDKSWTKSATEWFAHRDSNNEHCIIVADNAEGSYFLQGLLELDDAAFLQLGRTEEAYRMAAERFVSLARTRIRPAFFIFLTNNEDFALNFVSKANELHRDLISLEVLPFPSDRDKETAVRVNTNLLNSVTYWYCLDRAGPDGKKKVRDAILGNETFPGSFAAVNEALAQSDRTGRPANKCVLSLAVFTDSDNVPSGIGAQMGTLWEKLTWACDHLCVEFLDADWAKELFPDDPRRAKMLESEWSLRVVTFSNRLVAALLDSQSRECFSALLDKLSLIHGYGTQNVTMETYWGELGLLVNATPATWDKAAIESFWSKGQIRSHDYEAALKSIYPTYNSTDTGFLSYRPDLVIEPYSVCSVLNAISDSREAINEAIKRKTHVFEFTAMRQYSSDNVIKYLGAKARNYVDLLEQQ